ncbi:MAG: hypothetical protein HZB56_03475 [Deltaproteobacteria bacterium]|nr:hypothetical protein [Deltaproteobacteria bacterium]
MSEQTATAGTPPAPAPAGAFQRFWRSRARALAAAALGAAAGAAYAHFIGCRTGTCPLTSNVWTAGLYGAFVGGIAGWPSRVAAAPRRAAEGWEP